jgi:hypothetical protein
MPAGDRMNAYRILVGQRLGKRILGSPRRRCRYNIKMNIKEFGCEDGKWMELAQDLV